MATESELSAPQWWARHRLRYNVALIAAAPISFVCLLVVWWLFEPRLPCLEITGFGIALGAVLFAIGLAVANLLYFLGPLAEWLLHPRNTVLFRRRLYTLGTVFSILVVFVPVLGNLALALIGPSTVGKCG